MFFELVFVGCLSCLAGLDPASLSPGLNENIGSQYQRIENMLIFDEAGLWQDEPVRCAPRCKTTAVKFPPWWRDGC